MGAFGLTTLISASTKQVDEQAETILAEDISIPAEQGSTSTCFKATEEDRARVSGGLWSPLVEATVEV